MSKLDDLKNEVAAVKSTQLSAVTLLNGLSQRLKDALDSEDSDGAISDVIADLDASTVALASAVTANTPSIEMPVATSNTATTAPADLPDGHPLKPPSEDPPAV